MRAGILRSGFNIIFAGFVCVVGLFGVLGGLLISSFPAYMIYAGYVVFATGFLCGLCCFDCHRVHAFKIFLICWASGALVGTMFFVPLSIMAMVSTSIVHLPLLALACHVEQTTNKGRYGLGIIYLLAFMLAVFLPHSMVLTFEKSYPPHPEEIAVSADVLEDKKPPFIDENSMWEQGTVTPTSGLWQQSITYRINKSGAVIGLDVGELEDREKEAARKLFSTYEQAVAYARDKKLPVIPSVQMVDHKIKVFGDKFYAAIEEYLQHTAEVLGGGKEAFLERVLSELLKANDVSAECAQALAYVAAGLRLGGGELPKLPEEADLLRQKLEVDFLSSPIKSKPIGFYTESDELRRIFQQDRFYQTCLKLPEAIALAKLMCDNPGLRKQYGIVLCVYARSTNPPSRFSVNDVAEYCDYFEDAASLRKQMLQSKKWEVLKERGAGREARVPCIQFFPHSTSKENELFARIYNYSAELPAHNVMNRLIEAIRTGEIDLTPTDDSGWYDYQIHALETLLVPEKGQEGNKLLLTKAYKKRLIEAFKTILTKKRELHLKQVELIPTAGIALDPQYFTISPDLHLEPMATYYVRTARGMRFVLNTLELLLGKTSLEEIVIESGQSLHSVGQKMAELYYGFYLQVCEDIGMKPEFLREEMSSSQILGAKREAAQWLEDCEKDLCYEKDVRYIVPALTNPNRTKVRYWMTIGVKLLKVKAEYVRRPLVQILDAESNRVIQEIPRDTETGGIERTHLKYKFAPEEYYLPVEVFAEATGSAEPLTRSEFRKLCDRCKNKEEVVRAIAN